MLKRSHLRQFLAIVETGGFTSAGRRLHLTQPTLSAGLAELERLIGAQLITRDRRQIRLTPAGNRLLAHARTIEREFRLAETPAAEAPSMRATLRLGLLPSLPTRVINGLARALHGPRQLSLIEGSDADLRRRLGDNQLDVAITLLRGSEGQGAVAEEPYGMLLATGHALAERPSLTAMDLAGEDMVARRSCEILTETSRFFTAQGVRPHFVLRSANEERCLDLVRNGLAVTTGPASLAGDGIVAVPLEGYAFSRRLGLVCGERPVDELLLTTWQRQVGDWPAG